MTTAKWYWTFIDGWTMARRNCKHIFRNPESLMVSMALPVILMLLFVYVFGGAIRVGTDYINYVVPGIIIVCVGFGSSMTAVSVCQDMNGGLFDRFRSMPLNPSALLTGHVAGSFVRNAISTVLVILVAVLIGFRPEAGLLDWLAVIGLLSLFLLAVSWLAVVMGLLTKSVEAASSFSFFIMFLPYVSSAFVPTETMPAWLGSFAEYQPMTPLIDALRSFLIHTPADGSGLLAVIWFSGLLLVSFVCASVIFRNRKSV